jgi:hypothetical protein
MMIQKNFAQNVVDKIKTDESILALAAAGSWISNELDEFSDLDLILVTKEKISQDKKLMLSHAESFGNLISAFTGEHVGEPRVLICLYDDPLLHVDIKFVTADELRQRMEDPVILFERDQQLSKIIKETNPQWPYRSHQWIEDRFWTWIHYAALKLGRVEYFEAYDFLGDLRINVLSPLLLEKNKKPPRGLRKVEKYLPKGDLEKLKSTITTYDPTAIIQAIENSINIYKQIRKDLFSPGINLQTKAEEKALEYLELIKSRISLISDGFKTHRHNS